MMPAALLAVVDTVVPLTVISALPVASSASANMPMGAFPEPSSVPSVSTLPPVTSIVVGPRLVLIMPRPAVPDAVVLTNWKDVARKRVPPGTGVV